MPVNKDVETPGPGAYNLRSFQEPDKKYMSTSVFVSCTSRWTGDINESEIPGPSNNLNLTLKHIIYE